jgi:hypothetical protein
MLTRPRLWTMIAVLGTVIMLIFGCATTIEEPQQEPSGQQIPQPAQETAEEPQPTEQQEQQSQEPPVSYQVGDQGPAGGYIFYVDSTGQFEWTYLEAAPAGWYGQPEDPTMAWGNPEVPTGAEGREIGQGQTNNLFIFEQDSEVTAASIIAGITIGELSDWFLPSQDELNEIYNQIHRRGRGDFAREAYWTSTETSAERAITQNFSHSGQIAATKTLERRVRPIRAF